MPEEEETGPGRVAGGRAGPWGAVGRDQGAEGVRGPTRAAGIPGYRRSRPTSRSMRLCTASWAPPRAFLTSSRLTEDRGAGGRVGPAPPPWCCRLPQRSRARAPPGTGPPDAQPGSRTPWGVPSPRHSAGREDPRAEAAQARGLRWAWPFGCAGPGSLSELQLRRRWGEGSGGRNSRCGGTEAQQRGPSTGPRAVCCRGPREKWGGLLRTASLPPLAPALPQPRR